jgi:hypothetical protein
MKTLLGDLRLRSEIPPHRAIHVGYAYRLSLVLTPKIASDHQFPYTGIWVYAYETDMEWRWRKLPNNKALGRFLDFRYWEKLPIEVPTIPGEARYVVEKLGEQDINMYLETKEEIVDGNNAELLRWVNLHLQFVPRIGNLSGYLQSLARRIDDWVKEYQGDSDAK